MANIWDQAQKSIWDEAAASLQNGEGRNLAADARDKELYRTQFPEMAAQDAATIPTSGAVQQVRAENGPPLPPQPVLDTSTRSDGLISAPTQGYADPSKRPVVPPTDWAEVGRQQVRNLPKYGAAAGSALATVLAPEVTLPAMALGGVLGGAAGYQGGRAARAPIEAELGMAPSDQGNLQEGINSVNEGMLNTMFASPEAIPNAINLGKEVIGAGGRAVSKAAQSSRFPEKFASKYLQRPPGSTEVSAALENKIPLTLGNAVESAQKLKSGIWSGAEQSLQGGEEAGNIVNIEGAIDEARKVVDYYSRVRPNSPQLRAAQNELEVLENYPREMSPMGAEEKKQFYNQAIGDWERSTNKDLASQPGVAVQKAFKRRLVGDIAEQTANPEAYRAANEEYGPVARLFKNRGEFNPLERADMRVSEQNPIRRIVEMGKEYGASRPITWARGLGKTTPKVTDVANIGAPRGIAPKYAEPEASQRMPDYWQGPNTPSTPIESDYSMVQQLLNPKDAEFVHPAANLGPEDVSGTLMESSVPTGEMQPTPLQQLMRKPIEFYEPEMNRPPQVMPETENYPGTLMEGEVPSRSFKSPKKGRKK